MNTATIRRLIDAAVVMGATHMRDLDDGERYDLTSPEGRRAAIALLNNLEEARVSFLDADKKRLGVFLLVVDGDPEEYIADHAANAWSSALASAMRA